jgi:cation diffusion facilitator CzcD-associated flavoprotein CzcO
MISKNVYLGTQATSGSWDESHKAWTLKIKSEGKDERIITCSYVVIAAGGGGQEPVMPVYPNKGSQDILS